MSQINEYATTTLVSGSSGKTPIGIDFGGPMAHVHIHMDSTGLAFSYSFKSTSETSGPQMKALDEPLKLDFNSYISKMCLIPLTTATSTAAAGVAQLRIHAWG